MSDHVTPNDFERWMKRLDSQQKEILRVMRAGEPRLVQRQSRISRIIERFRRLTR